MYVLSVVFLDFERIFWTYVQLSRFSNANALQSASADTAILLGADGGPPLPLGPGSQGSSQSPLPSSTPSQRALVTLHPFRALLYSLRHPHLPRPYTHLWTGTFMRM